MELQKQHSNTKYASFSTSTPKQNDGFSMEREREHLSFVQFEIFEIVCDMDVTSLIDMTLKHLQRPKLMMYLTPFKMNWQQTYRGLVLTLDG
jgi:hypothetical protein